MGSADFQVSEAKNILTAMFERGFSTSGNYDKEFSVIEKSMGEAGMEHGAELVSDLRKSFANFSGGMGDISDTALKYSRLWEYLNDMSKQIVLLGVTRSESEGEQP